MLLYKNKGYVTNSEHPNDDWTGNADYVVPDGSELAEKIKGLYPYFDFVFDEKGQLTGVTPTERPPEPEPEPTIEEKLAELVAYNATLTECILEMSEYVYS